ncbi:nitrogen fixation negative regulator NifL [Varunaivibrio sulfuroxidans]|uniref:nitrogen fixation negative regulator NifL n=1 Tax=Varunaivibrio sulfuroxidans TaxID=1773489 RepID=UPI00140534C0|nr:nitrogen fixation negative regulator NifL [Varunaivibrio sulfuroxidans]WES32084.1 nitrogen fixation negative regulator NifL [Varunaivibrio sulfuroxidans]
MADGKGAEAQSRAQPGGTTPGSATVQLSRLLDAPPEGTPAAVLALLGDINRDIGGDVPLEVFRRVVENVPTAISVTDAHANILYVNPAFVNVSGYALADVMGKNESILSYKATPQTVYRDLWSTITEGRTWTGRLVNKRKDGGRYLAELTVVPVRREDGAISHYLGMHRDVSEMHSLSRKVRNQGALIESALAHAPVVVVLLDGAFEVAFANAAYRNLQRDCGDVAPAPLILNALGDLIKGGDVGGVEVHIAPEGCEPRWFSCSASWVGALDEKAESYFLASADTGLLLVLSDITAQRRQYEQVRTGAVRALMAERQTAESVREILSGAIYQFQGPLNVMAAAANMLERQGGADAGVLATLGDVLGAGRDALARLKAAMPDIEDEPEMPVNLNEIIRDVLDVSIETIIKEGISVDWRPARVLPNVPGRPNGLRLLVRHLLDNAVLAVKEPGGSGREVRIVTRALSDGSVALEIKDSGPGFAEGQRIKAFEAFYSGWVRTRRRSGIGLALARQVVSDQGGSIEAVDDDGGALVRTVFSPARASFERTSFENERAEP